ncbi:MAG: hypothetical protein JRI96_10385 [Deltaproteobacteria bacterium]|nr:hypothetical protein [Deltaproteobacteria bacterium]
MPTSNKYLITPVLEAAEQINPKTILDIGIGFGKWGFLLREYLELFHCKSDPFRTDSEKKWLLRIDGVEIYEKYITSIQRNIYDHIFIGDILTVIDKLHNYDLIILGDVIEHFSKEEGQILIHKCINKSNKAILITTPVLFHNQKDIFANQAERHKSIWTKADFKFFQHTQLYYNRGNIIIIISKLNQIYKIENTYSLLSKAIHDFIANKQSGNIEKYGISNFNNGFLLRFHYFLKKYFF